MRTTLVAVGMILGAMLVLAGCGQTQQLAESNSQADQPEASEGDSAAETEAASRSTPTPGRQGDAGDTQDQGKASVESQQRHDGHSEPVEVPPDAQTRRVKGSEFTFEPAELTVEAGRPVAVTLVNTGEVEHEWELIGGDGSEIAHAHAAAGEEATALFTLDEPGAYEVRCTVPGHTEAGMVGSVIAR